VRREVQCINWFLSHTEAQRVGDRAPFIEPVEDLLFTCASKVEGACETLFHRPRAVVKLFFEVIES
jgi:hypothetical protein